ncbi:phosphoethanolamine transferase [Aquabacterium sp.]|uniref:phosphoethanolamine transferase n=1 Tax=Aquabacterium sp. TaxID=1872578 RepID=UPI002B98F276|nr:phosphoethanolamine--lipid A transferase [Aquabacterium sp.]HSW07060.1 phosphoethanolamine--lipid A transferase [Aquabacterium sp.]
MHTTTSAGASSAATATVTRSGRPRGGDRSTAWQPAWLIGAVSLWIASAGNLALWFALHRLQLLAGWRGAGFAAGLGLGIAALLSLLLALLNWRRTLKPVLTLLLLAAAFGAHFMLSYGVVIDSTMVVNVLQTHVREALDLFSPRLLVTVLLIGVLPAAVVWRTPLAWGSRPRQLRNNLLLLLAAGALLAAALVSVYQPLSATSRNHRQLRYLVNPLNALVAAGQVAAQPLRRTGSQALLALGEDARLRAAAAQAKPPLLLLVLGETARSDHFALNGYARPTTPELAALGVTSQRNAWSCGTSTAASVPCMFSHLGREAYGSRQQDHETLVDVLQRAGLAVLWLDNQAGCKGVCERVPTVNTSALRHAGLCADGECLDEILLDGLDARIATLPAERRARGVVLVMHQMGSHGPAYPKRSPAAFKRFQPECHSAELQDCSRDEVVNAYDNSIAYTDHFLAAAIRWLQGRAASADTALLYVSDHGESLGENNLYLHGLPYALAPDAQKHVPWISWFSPGFAQRSGATDACLQQRLDEHVSHDQYFHSVLGLLDVHTRAYRPDWDFYRPCRQP